MFMDGLEQSHKEFVTQSNNSAIQGTKLYPIDFNEAYSRCVSFKPTIVYKTTIPSQNVFMTGEEDTNKKIRKTRGACMTNDKGVLVWKNSGKPVECPKCDENHLKFDCPENSGTKKSNQDKQAKKELDLKEKREILDEVLTERARRAKSEDVF